MNGAGNVVNEVGVKIGDYHVVERSSRIFFFSAREKAKLKR